MIEALEQSPWEKLSAQNAWPYAPAEVMNKPNAGLAFLIEVLDDRPLVTDVPDRTVELGDVTGQEPFKRFIDQLRQLMGIGVA